MATGVNPTNALPPDRLRWRCDAGGLPFETTADLEPAGQLIGQDRAMDAIRLAAGIRQPHFNLFVLGPSGTGRRDAVNAFLRDHARRMPVPDDWAYVNNFDAPDKPTALRLPPGTAQKLRAEMQDLVDDLAIDIPALFESEEYQTTRRAIEEDYGERQERAMSEFAERAKAEQVALLRTPMGFMLAATRNGETVKAEDFEKLPETERHEIEEKIARLQQALSEVLRNAPKLDRERRRKVEELNAEMTGQVVSDRVAETIRAFASLEAVRDYLNAVRQDLIDNAALFLLSAQEEPDGPFPDTVRRADDDPRFNRYKVNVMVSRADDDTDGAPLEAEDLPTMDRLTGRIEHVSQMGALLTDFTMIKPGALQRANGGFLVLDARRLLSEPMAWATLKQCLQSRCITISSMAERLSLVSTTSLQPDPIPLNLRIVLIGDRLLHALLVTMDPDFSDLFKVEADFEESLDLTDDTRHDFARLVAGRAARDGLSPISAAGVARILDEATRLAGDRQKLSLHLGDIDDLLREAAHHADLAGKALIDDRDIREAAEQKRRRSGRIKDRMREAVLRRTILIDTDGESIGQVNGLSVVGLGPFSFGRPSRITARTRMGTGKLIDIEREVELGGPLHSKGVLILGGYLAATYALDTPFSLHASLVFEQSYGGVDGDSASAAELFALISSLSGLPLRQGIAVTGSVNQTGHIQAIGGVNDKVEGFFETCLDQGLTGAQGVMIPAANVDHLMLRDDILEAVEQDRFHIYAIETIDQGIEVLTGRTAGQRQPDGRFEADSVNALVEARLRDFAESRLRFARMGQPGQADP